MYKEALQELIELSESASTEELCSVAYAALKGLNKLSADLSYADRKALPEGVFALPEKRKFPMPDEKHTRLAWQFVNRSSISDAEKATVRSRIKARAKEFGMDTSTWKAASDYPFFSSVLDKIADVSVNNNQQGVSPVAAGAGVAGAGYLGYRMGQAGGFMPGLKSIGADLKNAAGGVKNFFSSAAKVAPEVIEDAAKVASIYPYLDFVLDKTADDGPYDDYIAQGMDWKQMIQQEQTDAIASGIVTPGELRKRRAKAVARGVGVGALVAAPIVGAGILGAKVNNYARNAALGNDIVKKILTRK